SSIRPVAISTAARIVAGIPDGLRDDVVWTTPNDGALSIQLEPMTGIEPLIQFGKSIQSRCGCLSASVEQEPPAETRTCESVRVRGDLSCDTVVTSPFGNEAVRCGSSSTLVATIDWVVWKYLGANKESTLMAIVERFNIKVVASAGLCGAAIALSP